MAGRSIRSGGERAYNRPSMFALHIAKSQRHTWPDVGRNRPLEERLLYGFDSYKKMAY